jgi:hypothetical protein
MTTQTDFGKLQRVDLRTAWKTEAGGFTPWLANEENITLLGETLGLDLEVEAQEKGVGPFRADILCKDTATGHWVLIENQLERTDHGHLGQLLTYAAGLQAVTIVWIAQQFTDEHRATLDWLNEITNEDFSFFGLEIELWRIGSSPIAPKFNIVSKPNDWTKRPPTGTGENTPTKQLQLQYWTAFRDFVAQRKSFLKIQKPLPQHWTNVAIGRSYFFMIAAVNTREKEIAVELVIDGSMAKPRFRSLEAMKGEIEAVTKVPLDWNELPHRQQSRIGLSKKADPTVVAEWPAQHVWLLDTLEMFHRAFSQRIKTLVDVAPEPLNGDDAANPTV